MRRGFRGRHTSLVRQGSILRLRVGVTLLAEDPATERYSTLMDTTNTVNTLDIDLVNFIPTCNRKNTFDRFYAWILALERGL